MALVDEQQRVLGQIFEQRRRRLAGQAAGEEAAVILDAVAAAGRGDHLQVEVGALLEPLMLDQLALRLQLLEPLGQLVADRLGRLLHRRAGGDVVRVGVDADVLSVAIFLPVSGSNSTISSISSPKKEMRQALSS